MRPTQMTCRPEHAERNARILALAGTMTIAEIAGQLDLPIGVISGVIRRAHLQRARRARPREVVKTIRLPADLAEKIERQASRRHTSLSTFLREAARQALAARQLTSCQRPEES
jgi:hypothetical protein